jgi:hypothetical protein
MILWAAILVTISGMAVVLGGVLAIAGSQTRLEEELARQPARSSRRAA